MATPRKSYLIFQSLHQCQSAALDTSLDRFDSKFINGYPDGFSLRFCFSIQLLWNRYSIIHLSTENPSADRRRSLIPIRFHSSHWCNELSKFTRRSDLEARRFKFQSLSTVSNFLPQVGIARCISSMRAHASATEFRACSRSSCDRELSMYFGFCGTSLIADRFASSGR